MPKCLKDISNILSERPDFKYICGDKITIYDISVAGYIYNVMLNPKAERLILINYHFLLSLVTFLSKM